MKLHNGKKVFYTFKNIISYVGFEYESEDASSRLIESNIVFPVQAHKP